MLYKYFIAIILVLPFASFAQIDSLSIIKEQNASENNNEQYAGLGKAASAIFNSDKRYSISGFGEANYIYYEDGNDKSLGDLELYYTSLFRFSTFFGFKITDKIIINSEILIEHLRDGDEYETLIIPELYLDARFNKNIGIRVGYIPLTIGYINSNDEPVLFHSVNRPEVERVIIPTSWIGIGATAYGQVLPNLNYFVGIFSTPDASEFISPTFIRGGSEPRFEIPKSLGLNYQLLYSGIEGMQVSISGFFGDTGQGHQIVGTSGNKETVKSFLNLTSAFIRYDFSNVRLIAMGSYSSLSNTEQIYKLTKEHGQAAQVIGEEAYGYYGEIGLDILHYFNINRSKHGKFWNLNEMELPLFVRYERLNTHHSVAQSISNVDYNSSNLEIFTLGLNFKPNEDFVLKFNYQLRENKSDINLKAESNLIEFGFGFNF
ncbi:MAG: porin [Flavobacteriales bacterium]|nr:porin [Flavobacteriales bacterium]